ncbi:MAG: glycosyltransferase family 4 protein [Methylococcaceae bacterium]|nr:glycosyltransferase family 4 protein [Methylococcaceae bacterium]
MMSPKRIVQIVTRLDIGGVPEHLLTLTEGLVQHGYDVAIVCNHISDPIKLRLQELGIHNIKLIKLHRLPHPGDLISIWHLYNYLRESKFDIVHTHMSKAALLGCLTAQAAKVPVIVNTAHNLGCLAFKNPLVKALFWMYDKALFAVATDAVILVSDSIRKQVIANRLLPEHKAIYVPNGIKVNDSTAGLGEVLVLKNQLKIAPDNFVIGTVARLVWFKGLHTLIAAMPDILKEHPNTTLIIIGDGPLKQELEQQARVLKVAQSVMFLGERSDAVELLPVLDIFVLPSVSEGMPITILEAMAAAKPVVATKVGGIPELVSDGQTGILVPSEEPKSMALAISKLLSDPYLCKIMGLSGKKRVINEFSVSNMVENTISAYLL